ncbi:MAG: histidine kinase N-terminal 7TM domain-containing protein [Candidatus Hodarchaeota archaeon]
MIFNISIFSVLMGLITLSGLFTFLYTMIIRPKSTTKDYFLIMASFAIIFCMSYTIVISLTDFQLIKYFIYFELLGVIFLIPMFLLFILHYTRGIIISEKPIILLSFVPSFLHFMVLITNEINGGLFYASMTPNTTPPFYRFNLWTCFFSHVIYNYILLIIGFSILIQTYMTSTKGGLYRKQVLIMIVGASFPSVVTLIRVLNLIPSIHFLDLTPFSFIVTFILYYYVLFEYGLLLHIPISLHRVFESINDGVVVLDRDFRIMNINQSAGLKFLSIFKDEISSIHGNNFLHTITNIERQSKIKIDASKLRQGLDYLQNKEIGFFECGIKILKPDQDPPQAHFSVSMTSVLQTSKGSKEIIGYILNLRDITELKEKEELLRESEEHYRTLTRNLNVGVFRAHMYEYMDTKIVEVNPAFLEMFGYTNLQEIEQVGRAALFATHEERVRFNDEMIEKGRVTNLEIGLKKKNGTIFNGSISSVIIREEDKGYAIWDGIVEDITDRKTAEYRANFLDSLLRHDISNKIHIIFPLILN